MHDQVRNEELHVWRARIKNGMFDPADLCDFASRLMDALESSEADLDRSCQETRANFSELYRMATEVVPELKKRIADLESEVANQNKILRAAQECVLEGDSKSIQEGDKLDCALLHDIANLFASNRCTRADNALKTKMVDWLVDKLSFNTGCGPYYDECPRLCATGKRECLAHDFDAGDFDYGPCWKARAIKEVMRHGS